MNDVLFERRCELHAACEYDQIGDRYFWYNFLQCLGSAFVLDHRVQMTWLCKAKLDDSKRRFENAHKSFEELTVKFMTIDQYKMELEQQIEMYSTQLEQKPQIANQLGFHSFFLFKFYSCPFTNPNDTK